MKKIAFLILAHEDPKHLRKLVEALNFNSDIYIHIDKKADISKFKVEIQYPNVFFIEDRIAVSWAGISMVDALMKLIQETLKQSENYSHAFFLTGSCYPIKEYKTIYSLISSQPEREFIKLVAMRESPEHLLKHISQKWFKEPFINSNNKMLNIIDKGIRFIFNKFGFKNDWNQKIIPYFGHTWCALTMNSCKYIFNYHINNPWFREMNKLTFSPDEHYLHTIIGNSDFLNSSLGIAQFQGRGLYKYTTLHLIDPTLTKWYTEDDWQEIIESDKLFVRKVRSNDGIELIKRINQEILHI